MAAYCFKTIADPHVGKISLLRVFPGGSGPTRRWSTSAPTARSAWASCFELQGKDHTSVTELGPGAIGAVAKLKEVATGDVLADTDATGSIDRSRFPRPWS